MNQQHFCKRVHCYTTCHIFLCVCRIINEPTTLHTMHNMAKQLPRLEYFLCHFHWFILTFFFTATLPTYVCIYIWKFNDSSFDTHVPLRWLVAWKNGNWKKRYSSLYNKPRKYRKEIRLESNLSCIFLILHISFYFYQFS
jgi:hypothetical protein